MNFRRIFKISLITLVSLIIVSVALVSSVFFLINPNDYKPLIVKAVDASTGRKLSLNGDISWKIWPNIGLHIAQASLSNPAGFKQPDFVSIAAADVSVQLLPLLHHNVIVNSLTLDGLNLALIKNGNLNNWTFNAESELAENGESATASPKMHLELSGLIIKNSTISYTDLKNNSSTIVKDFDFSVKANHDGIISLDQDKEIFTLKDVTVALDNLFKANVNLELNNFSDPHYTGNIDIEEFSIIALANKLNIPVKALAGKDIFKQFAMTTKFNGDVNNLKLDNFSFNFAQDLTGKMSLALNNFSDPKYSGKLNLNAASLSHALDQLSAAKTKSPTKATADKLVLTTDFSGDNNKANLDNFSFNYADTLKGRLNMLLSNFSNPNYSGKINLSPFSLNQLMDKAGITRIDIPNKTLLDHVAYSSNFTGNNNSINLSQIVAAITGSNITGNLNVLSIKPLKLDENIRVDAVELSDLTDCYGYKLPLHGIKADGSFSNSSSNMKNFATMDAKQNINVDNVTVLGFSLNSLVAQLDNAITDTGKIVSVDNLQQINNSLQVVNGIKNMQATIAKAQTKGAKDYSQKTNLGSLTANLVINHGIANPATFKLSGPSIKSSGQGTVNLVKDTLDYTVTTQLITPQKNTILNQILFPYIMHGSFSNMDGTLDWGSIQKQLVEYLIKNTSKQVKSAVKNQAQQQLNNVIDQQVPQAATPLKQGAQKLLNGIFGN